MLSPFLGRRYESLVPTALSLESSTQNCKVPSFFGTNKIDETHSVRAGSMTLIASIMTILLFELFALLDRHGTIELQFIWLPARETRL